MDSGQRHSTVCRRYVRRRMGASGFAAAGLKVTIEEKLRNSDGGRYLMKLTLIATACLWTGGLGVVAAQTLEVTPQVVMSDESAVIRAKGLQPNERIMIRRPSSPRIPREP